MNTTHKCMVKGCKHVLSGVELFYGKCHDHYFHARPILPTTMRKFEKPVTK